MSQNAQGLPELSDVEPLNLAIPEFREAHLDPGRHENRPGRARGGQQLRENGQQTVALGRQVKSESPIIPLLCAREGSNLHELPRWNLKEPIDGIGEHEQHENGSIALHEVTRSDVAAHASPRNLPSEVTGVLEGSEQNSEPEVHPFENDVNPLESAMAYALGEAAKAGQWAVISEILAELRARRELTAERERAENEERGGTVLPFRPKA